jgi:hypothetical protein
MASVLGNTPSHSVAFKRSTPPLRIRVSVLFFFFSLIFLLVHNFAGPSIHFQQQTISSFSSPLLSLSIPRPRYHRSTIRPGACLSTTSSSGVNTCSINDSRVRESLPSIPGYDKYHRHPLHLSASEAIMGLPQRPKPTRLVYHHWRQPIELLKVGDHDDMLQESLW